MLLMKGRTARIAQHTRGAIRTTPALGGHAEIELQALEAVRAIGRSLADLAL